jgi:hypothetical protein
MSALFLTAILFSFQNNIHPANFELMNGTAAGAVQFPQQNRLGY